MTSSARRPLPTPLRTAAALLLAFVLAIGLSACGEKKEAVGGEVKQDRVILLLDWTPNANHAGIYTGIKNDRFTDQGIALEPQVPSDAASIIKQVAAGRADLGISYQPEVMSARDEGAKIKAIATIIPRPLNSLMWLKSSKIKSVKDLKGKTVATAGTYQSAYLETTLKDNGVDPKSVKQVNVNYSLVTALISGKADAVIGVYPNVEGVILKQRKKPVTIVPVDKAGVPPYNELVIIANENNLKDGKRAEIYRRVIAGLQRGTTDAIANAKAAETALIEADKELAKDKSLPESIKVTLPLLKQGTPYGKMDPNIWLDFANWMRDNGLLKNAPDVPAAFTNDLLPGQPPKDSQSTSSTGGY